MMTITEIIARLEEIRAAQGDIEVEVATDEGDAVEFDIHIDRIGDTNILTLY